MSFMHFSIVPPVLAHRGAKVYAPENTLSAFSKAKQLGFNWIEFDVMLAACGEVVVFHDEELQRTTNGSGKIIEHPYSYLKTMDAGSWFDPIFCEEKIPTLQQVLLLMQTLSLAANIEIKALPGKEEFLVNRVINVLQRQEHLLTSPFFISSFSRTVLQLFRQKSPHSALGFLMDEWQQDGIEFAEFLDAATINVNQNILNPERVKTLKSTGRMLLTYTVNELNRAKELFSWGVDGIFSDGTPEIIDGFISNR